MGARPVVVPLTEIVDVPAGMAALAAVDLAAFEWVVVTSANAADRLVAAHGPSLPGVAVARGRQARRRRTIGASCRLVPTEQRAEGLLAELPPPGAAGGQILVVQAVEAAPTLVRGLVERGWQVTAVAPYRSVPRRPGAGEQLAALAADVVLFASGSAARAWVAVFGTSTPPVVVAMGPQTAAAVTARRADGHRRRHGPLTRRPRRRRRTGAGQCAVASPRRKGERRAPVGGRGHSFGSRSTAVTPSASSAPGQRSGRRRCPGRGRPGRGQPGRAPDRHAAAAPVTLVDGPARTPAVSADGRLVVYAAAPATRGRPDQHDLAASTGCATRPPSSPPPVDGLRAGNSVRPAISADGCHVVAVTEIPYDLFRDDDTGARWDVYQLTLPSCGGTAGDWELVSSRPEDTFGSAAGDDADPEETPAISGSGTIVAYTRAFSPTTANDGVRAVAVVDRAVPLGQQGRTRAVAGTPAQAPAGTSRYHGQHQPAVSDDGRFVAFTSDADSAAAVPAWSAGAVAGQFADAQVYVWDRQAPDPGSAVVAVSAPSAGPANGDAGHAALSHDGRFVVFASTTTNLVAGAALPSCTSAPLAPSGAPVSEQPVGPEQPLAAGAVDIQTDTDAAAATAAADASPADDAAASALRSGGDPAVAAAPVPAVAVTTCPAQIYRVDRTDGSIDLVSRRPDVPGATPVAADLGGADPAITYDGSTVVFTTRSRNLFDDAQATPTFDATGGEVVVATVDSRHCWPACPSSPTAPPPPRSPSRQPGSAPMPARSCSRPAPRRRSTLPSPSPAASHAAVASLAPKLRMADVDVGTVAVGSPSGTWYVGVVNDGPTPFVPATITSSNPEFAVVGGTCQLGVVAGRRPVVPGARGDDASVGRAEARASWLSARPASGRRRSAAP